MLPGHMNFDIDGLNVVRTSERGTFVEFEVAAEPAQLAEVVAALLEALPDGGEISVPEPGPHECYHECQRANGVLQIKRGCHGSHGTWRDASNAEAHEWLLPGFAFAASTPRAEPALVRVAHAVA